MNFSEEWESVYRVGAHMSVWPWSDLVSFVHRHAKPADGFRRVLEVGCGAGANIPFFLKLGVDFYGIDGSPEIVGMLHKSFPQLRDNIVLGDFTQSLPFAGQFDLVVDRVTNGSGVMPSFKDQFSEEQIQNVAAYVVESTK